MQLPRRTKHGVLGLVAKESKFVIAHLGDLFSVVGDGALHFVQSQVGIALALSDDGLVLGVLFLLEVLVNVPDVHVRQVLHVHPVVRVLQHVRPLVLAFALLALHLERAFLLFFVHVHGHSRRHVLGFDIRWA